MPYPQAIFFWTLGTRFCGPAPDWCLQRSQAPWASETVVIEELEALAVVKKMVSFAEKSSQANFALALDQGWDDVGDAPNSTLEVYRTGPEVLCLDSC